MAIPIVTKSRRSVGAAIRAGTKGGPVTDAEYRALAQFRQALRAFLHFSEEAVHATGLTPSQHQLLLAIRGSEPDQPPTIGEIADRLKLRHHSAVELVNRAVQSGLVNRVPDASDRRRQRVELTDLGLAKLEALSTLHREELRRFREEGLIPLRRL
jgi:DNA-binding MarR family transcriptional regulator